MQHLSTSTMLSHHDAPSAASLNAALMDAKMATNGCMDQLQMQSANNLFIRQHLAAFAAAAASGANGSSIHPAPHATLAASGSSDEACSSHDGDDGTSDTDSVHGAGGAAGVMVSNGGGSTGQQLSSPSSGGASTNGTGIMNHPNANGDMSSDAEGVWSPDIEQAFQEALAIYPPCGRRKIILSDEGKMYGRNELIARYIKLRTAKTRTRKQVSSHIQVLARKKSRELSSKLKDQGAKEKALASLSTMSSAQIVTAHARAMNGLGFYPPHSAGGLLSPGGYSPPPTALGVIGSTAMDVMHADIKPFAHIAKAVAAGYPPCSGGITIPSSGAGFPASAFPIQLPPLVPAYEGRISTSKIRLCEFSAYLEQSSSDSTDPLRRHELVSIGSNQVHEEPLEAIDISQIVDKFPDKKEGLRELFDKGPPNSFFLVKFWADINFSVPDEASALYAVDSRYESGENMAISVSTKVCSFGKQVVEKVETEYARFENGRFVFRIKRSPMCEYMTNFIHKLKHLPEKYMMNSVLENFTILQLVRNRESGETLLCIAFVFEVSESDGSEHHIYRLIRDSR